MAPCRDAMIKEVLTLKPDNTVAEAMEIYKKQNIRSLPVVDDEGNLVGLMGLRHVLVNLLPKSVTMEDGVQRLDYLMGAAPGIAKRLRKTLPLKVEEVMDTNPMVLEADTSTSEAVRVMALHGSPLSDVEPESGKFLGMISRQTLLGELEHLMLEMEAEGQ